MVQHQVKFPNSKGEDIWFPSEKLGSIKEKCKVTIVGEDKREIVVDLELNHETKHIEAEVMMVPVEKKTFPLEILRFFIAGCRQCTRKTELMFNQ